VGVLIEDVEAASVQSITQRKAYGRRDAIDRDAVVSYVVVGRCVLVAGDGYEDVGGVGGGVGGGNRTLMETFLACKIVDLIRARIESILASRIQESTAFIYAFEGTGLGDDIGEGSGDAENGDGGDSKVAEIVVVVGDFGRISGEGGSGLEGDGKRVFVGVLEGCCVVDFAGLLLDDRGEGGRAELDFSRSSFLTDAGDQMMGVEVGAVTEDGAVSWDLGGCSVTGGGEGVDCEIDNDFGDDGDAETNGFGGESDEVRVSGRDDVGVSRSAFLTDAEDQMLGIEVGAVTVGGVVSRDFGGCGTTEGGEEGVGCEIEIDFREDGDSGEEDVATIRAESSVIIVDTNAFTSCGE